MPPRESTFDENEIAVVVDAPKNAVPDGTAPVLQLVAALKLPEPGVASQVASCASAGSAQHSADEVSNAARRDRRTPPRRMFGRQPFN
jgi:hypothetical protein